MYIRYGRIWPPFFFLEIQNASPYLRRPLEVTEASNLGEEDTILIPSLYPLTSRTQKQ